MEEFRWMIYGYDFQAPVRATDETHCGVMGSANGNQKS
jgi:hypothetical protein